MNEGLQRAFPGRLNIIYQKRSITNIQRQRNQLEKNCNIGIIETQEGQDTRVLS